jgi:hypothetical protein
VHPSDTFLVSLSNNDTGGSDTGSSDTGSSDTGSSSDDAAKSLIFKASDKPCNESGLVGEGMTVLFSTRFLHE